MTTAFISFSIFLTSGEVMRTTSNAEVASDTPYRRIASDIYSRITVRIDGDSPQ